MSQVDEPFVAEKNPAGQLAQGPGKPPSKSCCPAGHVEHAAADEFDPTQFSSSTHDKMSVGIGSTDTISVDPAALGSVTPTVHR